MEHARSLVQDALEVLNAAAAVSNPPLKDVLAHAALSAAEQAVTELRRHLQPNPAPPASPLLDLTPIEPAEEEDNSLQLHEPADFDEHPASLVPMPRPYLDFVAAMVPVLRRAYPSDRQRMHITRIGQLWQRYKNATSLSAAIAAATEDVQNGGATA